MSRASRSIVGGRGALRWGRNALKACLPASVLSFYRWKRHETALARLVDRYGRGARPIIPERRLDDLLPPSAAAEVRLPMAAFTATDTWTMPPGELATLAAICARAQPRRVFEIGTYTGLSTLTMAMNLAAEAELFTLDLAPHARATHVHGLGTGGFHDFEVGAHVRGLRGGPRVHQLYGDARHFDPAPFRGAVDLVLIDADHTYDFVRADTEHALAMVRPGGLVIWDDYVWTEFAPECAGVTRCVNELARTRPIHRVAGTRLALLIEGPPP